MGTHNLKETSIPWYVGLTFEQIAARLDGGTAPGSDVPGAWIEVPRRFLTWYRLRRSGAAPRPAKADSDITCLTERVRNVERTVERLAAESRGVEAQFETIEANLQGLMDAVGKLSGRIDAVRAIALLRRARNAMDAAQSNEQMRCETEISDFLRELGLEP